MLFRPTTKCPPKFPLPSHHSTRYPSPSSPLADGVLGWLPSLSWLVPHFGILSPSRILDFSHSQLELVINCYTHDRLLLSGLSLQMSLKSHALNSGQLMDEGNE
ncbi:hypothetical protein V3C99_009414 [Haemonchus contortus]